MYKDQHYRNITIFNLCRPLQMYLRFQTMGYVATDTCLKKAGFISGKFIAIEVCESLFSLFKTLNRDKNDDYLNCYNVLPLYE